MKKVHEINVTEHEWYRSKQSYLKLQGVTFDRKWHYDIVHSTAHTKALRYEHSMQVRTLFFLSQGTKTMYSTYVYFWD